MSPNHFGVPPSWDSAGSQLCMTRSPGTFNVPIEDQHRFEDSRELMIILFFLVMSMYIYIYIYIYCIYIMRIYLYTCVYTIYIIYVIIKKNIKYAR